MPEPAHDPQLGALFYASLQYAPFGAIVASTDQDGRCVYTNPEFTRITGYELDDIPTVQDWLNKAYPDPEYRAWVVGNWPRDVDPENMHRDVVYEIACRDGARKDIQFRASLLCPGRMFVMLLDVTWRRLREEQLRQSARMEAIGQMAGGIAHDFNNQLSGILGFGDLLRTELEQNEELAEYADKIVRSAERAAQLTRQLLSFARPDRLTSAPIDIDATVRAAVALLRRSIDKQIEIEENLGAGGASLMGDAAQIETVLLNLGLNARDALNGSGRIVFETGRETLDTARCAINAFRVEPGEYARIRVRDTGRGIEPALRARIFEPFFTTKPRGQATGMGLAAVYGIVKTHHGAVAVESAPGEGAVFTLYLPLAPAARDPGAAPPAAPRERPQKATVLVVDDEENVAAMATAMLRRAGFHVVVCTNGREAVETYRVDPGGIDLVLLDIVMPEMGGSEAVQYLKSIDADVRLVLTSGYGMTAEVQELLAAGALGFVPKPYRRAELLQAVHAALSNEPVVSYPIE